MSPADLLLAFLTGLLGSAHCIGMCGGFPLLLSVRMGEHPGLLRNLSFGLGRVLTYSIIGAVTAGLGSLADAAASLAGFQRAALLYSSLLMLVAGAILSLSHRDFFSSSGTFTQRVWFRKKLWRMRHGPGFLGSIGFGMLVGMIPCGMVYTMAIRAAGAGGIISGGLLMASFGVGTIPAMTGFGFLAQRLTVRWRDVLYRASGGVIMSWGIWGIVRWWE